MEPLKKIQEDREKKKADVIEEMKILRRHLTYKINFKLMVGGDYDEEQAKAILIYLAMTSLNETDRIVVLGAFRLLPQFQKIKGLKNRRIKVKEMIQYEGQADSLDKSENKAFEIIVDSYIDAFLDAEIWKGVAKDALSEYYDSTNKKAILPTISASTAPVAALSLNDSTVEEPMDGVESGANDEDESFSTTFDLLEKQPTASHKNGSRNTDISSDTRNSDVISNTKESEGNQSIFHFSKKELKFFIIVFTPVFVLTFIFLEIALHMSHISKFADSAHILCRREGDITWSSELYSVEVGDVVELKLTFDVDPMFGWKIAKAANKLFPLFWEPDMQVQLVIPNSLEYIEDSTMIYNSLNPEGVSVSESDITSSAIYLTKYYSDGDKTSPSSSYMQCKYKVVDRDLKNGDNLLAISAKIIESGSDGPNCWMPVHVIR